MMINFVYILVSLKMVYYLVFIKRICFRGSPGSHSGHARIRRCFLSYGHVRVTQLLLSQTNICQNTHKIKLGYVSHDCTNNGQTSGHLSKG